MDAGSTLGAHLLRQFDLARRLAEHHFAGLSDAEIMWRPAARGLHVWRRAGRWQPDWPDTEAYELGPSSIAWLGWHMGYWLTSAIAQPDGGAQHDCDGIAFPGPQGLVPWLERLLDQWRQQVAGLDTDALAAPARWPAAGWAMSDVAAWANLELMKNVAEIGAVRFHYAVRQTP